MIMSNIMAELAVSHIQGNPDISCIIYGRVIVDFNILSLYFKMLVFSFVKR
jgi:hypothetical protein